MHDGARLGLDLEVGEAEAAVARAGEGGVAGAVALERLTGVVVAPAVGLDGDAVCGEEEVDLEALGVGVDLRRRQRVRSAEGEEALLEVALGERRAGGVAAERRGGRRGGAEARGGAGPG